MFQHRTAFLVCLLAVSSAAAEDAALYVTPSLPQQSNACSSQPSPSTFCGKTGAACDASGEAGTLTEKQLLLQRKLAELEQLQREIDELRVVIGTAQQILVRVQILEVNLTELRRAGVDIEDLAGVKATTNDFAKVLNGLKQHSLAKVLAEPSVVTVSGRPTSVHSGGEIPIPGNADAKTSLEFVKVGTELDVVAVALGNDKVRLDVRTRVSTPIVGSSPTTNRAVVPPMSVRQIHTATQLSFGESAVLAGLVEERLEAFKVNEQEESVETVEYRTLFVITPELAHSSASAGKATRRENRK